MKKRNLLISAMIVGLLFGSVLTDSLQGNLTDSQVSAAEDNSKDVVISTKVVGSHLVTTYQRPDGTTYTVTSFYSAIGSVEESRRSNMTVYSENKDVRTNVLLRKAIENWNKSFKKNGSSNRLSLVNNRNEALFILSNKNVDVLGDPGQSKEEYKNNDSKTYIIVGGTFRISTTAQSQYSDIQLQSVIEHELGHLMGLGDIPV